MCWSFVLCVPCVTVAVVAVKQCGKPTFYVFYCEVDVNSIYDANNSGNVSLPVANPQQFHPNASQAFPYSAPPL